MANNVLYEVALTKVKGLGPIQAKVLLSHFKTAQNCFEVPVNKLSKLDGFGDVRVQQFYEQNRQAVELAKKELKFLETKPTIQVVPFTNPNYPNRLKYCEDSPIVLYADGNMNLNHNKILAMVGTRKLTDYGRGLIKDFLFELKDSSVVVVSGLAYGTDTFVHQTCVEYGIETVGVLAHGLDRLYPNTNKNLALEMKKNGGLVTEYGYGTKPNRENFPSRNRIIAGLSDATIVVESDVRGGSLITAEIANSYKRDVFAFPGDVKRQYSAGCNLLIKQQRANLIEHFEDVCFHLGWTKESKKSQNRQRQLFVELSDQEQKVAQVLNEQNYTATEISIKSGLTVGNVHTVLLNLELKGIVRIAPGNRYSLI